MSHLTANQADRKARLQTCQEYITRQAIDTWREHDKKETPVTAAHLTQTFPVLAKVNAPYANRRHLQDWLREQIEAGDEQAFKIAGHLDKEAFSAVLHALVNALKQTEDRDLRRLAANALRQIGAALPKEAVEELMKALKQAEDEDLCLWAAEALAGVGAALPKEAVQELMEAFKQTKDRTLRIDAAHALQKWQKEDGRAFEQKKDLETLMVWELAEGTRPFRLLPLADEAEMDAEEAAAFSRLEHLRNQARQGDPLAQGKLQRQGISW